MSINLKEIDEQLEAMTTLMEAMANQMIMLRQVVINLAHQIPQAPEPESAPEWHSGLKVTRLPNDLMRFYCPVSGCQGSVDLDVIALDGSIAIGCRDCGIAYYARKDGDKFYWKRVEATHD